MTTPNPFAQPSAGGDKFEPKDFAGALLIVFPKSYNPNEQTQFGPSTSADCDIVVVDRPGPDGKPTYKANARLFGNLANSVRDSIGGQVLGRLAQVPTNKGNPAWVLSSYTDADVQAAMPALTAYQQGQFKTASPASAGQASPASPPPAYDPWQGMNAAPAAPAAVQQQYAPPPAPAAPAGAPQGDPLVGFLTSRGMDPNAVAAMDPATRQAVAQQLGYGG